MVQVTDLFHTDEFIFVWSLKNGNGCQNRSSGAKTLLLRWAGAKAQFPGDTRNVGGRRGLAYIVERVNCLLNIILSTNKLTEQYITVKKLFVQCSRYSTVQYSTVQYSAQGFNRTMQYTVHT